MNAGIPPLIEKAERYLHSAEVLRQVGDLDSAASRLYYAMFYCAEALLAGRGLHFSSHRAVHSAFAKEFVKTGRLPEEMHAWLREAFDKRQLGDYAAHSAFESAEIEAMQSNAADFVRRTKTLLGAGRS